MNIKKIVNIKSMASLAVCLFFLSACGGGSNPADSSSDFSSSLNSSISSSASSTSSSSSSSSAQPLSVSIDLQTEYQTIDGFGAALPMWTPNFLTSVEVQRLVGTGDSELGLSILRTIIRPNSDDWPRAVNNLLEAKSYGENVKILATPWSPPAEMKDTNDVTNGGKLLLEHYGDYASHLNDYVSYMASEGVTIDVVSIQNEPDWHPEYESGDWTGEELRNFVRDHGDVIQAKVLVGESLRFDRDYTDPSLNDEQALDNFEIVGGHLYSAQNSGNFVAYPLAEEKNKALWMTEWLTHEADDALLDEGQRVAPIWGGNNQEVWDETLDVVLASVHQSMEVSWNAYIWWWGVRFYSLMGDGDENTGTIRGEILKRGWAYSHYAKFIRPGSVRVAAETLLGNVSVTAYTSDEKTVIVLLNRSTIDYENVTLGTGGSFAAARATITSQSQNREALTITGTDNVYSLPELAARSVVTVELLAN